MINDANIDLAGFVASEPSFKRLATGTSTAKLRVAYTERRFNRETGEWGDGPTSFVTVLCWRTLADNVAVCLRKGEPVLVRGRLRVREYESKDGSRGTETEIEASSIGHDLNRGVAHFSRTRRAPGETAAENAGAQAAGDAQDGEESAGQDGADGTDGAGLPGGQPGERASGKNGGGKNGAGKAGAGKNGAAGNDSGGDVADRGSADGDGAGEDGAGEDDGSVLDERAVAAFAAGMSQSPDGVPV
ncbi:MAG TPA: single-stranded DNA-binding protein [Streptosporangiaceae bacterium]|nr:single-stranded DNA-binding protein [Streptosporangiaceae bacterium]